LTSHMLSWSPTPSSPAAGWPQTITDACRHTFSRLFHRWLVLGCLVVIGLTWGVFAQSAYNLEVVVRTGQTISVGNVVTALGIGPSINDSGSVAYVVTIQDGRQAVFVSGETSARSELIDSFDVDGVSFCGLARNFYFPDS